jgi:hypothetical protein
LREHQNEPLSVSSDMLKLSDLRDLSFTNSELVCQATELGIQDTFLNLIQFPNVNFNALKNRAPRKYADYLQIKLKQLKLKRKDYNEIVLSSLIEQCIRVLQMPEEEHAYASKVYLWCERQRITLFTSKIPEKLKKKWESEKDIVDGLERDYHLRINLKIKKKTVTYKGFMSRSLSKYIIQNIIEWLDWKPSIKYRGVCKKMRDAMDMYLVNLSMVV